MLSAVISILIGIIIFVLGYWLELPIVMFIGAAFIGAGVLVFLSTIAGYGKSESEKNKIYKDIMQEFHEGSTRRVRYTMFKRTMNDKINEDIKNDISGGINRSSRH